MTQRNPVTPTLLDQIQDAFNRQDVDGILSHFADDCLWVMARGPEPQWGRRCRGKAEIGEVLRSRFAVIKDMRWVDMSHFIAGNRAASEWTVQGTLPSGERLDLKGCDLWAFNDEGKVVKKDTYWKTIEG